MNIAHKYIITLQQISGCGNKALLTIGNFIHDNSIEVGSLKELLSLVMELRERKLLKRFPAVGLEELEEAEGIAERILEADDRYQIGTLSYWDEAFPEELRNTVDEKGKLNPPVLLYYKGDLSCLSMPGLAVIGTREVTPEGEKAGMYLSRELARRGFCIVSGLALGCDTCGHLGALEAQGKTVAFLAHGLDTVYPVENRELAERIVRSGGLLLSEYPVGSKVNRYGLVARDRLQAGLAKATLVVQTGVKGGTMHAANATLQAEKPLLTVWYCSNLMQGHEMVKGNELLVKKGARYVTGTTNLDKLKDWILRYFSPAFRLL